MTATGDLGGSLAARIMPDPATGARETEIQRHLADVGFPTPTVRLAAPPSPELKQAWMLMDFAPGQPLLASLSEVSALAQLPTLAQALPGQLARHAAALHRVDPAAMAARLRRVDPSFDLRVADMVRNLGRMATGIGRPDLAIQARRLAATRPTSEANPVICHGDLHPFNILTDPAGDTVLDWSAARIADPAYDITYTHLLLSNPPVEAPGLLQPVINRAGQFLANRFVKQYRRYSNQTIDDKRFDWFTALHCLRILLEVGMWEANNTTHERTGHPYLSMGQLAADRLRRVTGACESASR